MSVLHIVIAGSFWLFLISSLAIFFFQGERLGQAFAMTLLTTVLFTFFANAAVGTRAAYPIVVGLDLSLLVVVMILAARCSRYWPLWFAGFHSISVASGIAYLLFPAQIPEIYIDAAGFWSLPALGAAVAGVLLDRRADLRIKTA
jgi:hypothetical protein